MQDAGYKRCKRCGETKPRSEFHRRRSDGTDGHASWCKVCKNGADKRTREQENARKSAYYWANKPERQAYVKANLHLYREQMRRRRSDPETRARINEQTRRGRAADPTYPERARLMVARRAALKLAAFVEDVHPLVVLERDDGVCGICGGDVDPFDFHVDHIVPLSKGGEHSYANTQTAHPICNIRKGAKAP